MHAKSKNDLGLNFHDHIEFLKYWHLTGPKLFETMEEYHKEWEESPGDTEFDTSILIPTQAVIDQQNQADLKIFEKLFND